MNDSLSLEYEDDDDAALWEAAGMQHMLDAYADEDAVYDQL